MSEAIAQRYDRDEGQFRVSEFRVGRNAAIIGACLLVFCLPALFALFEQNFQTEAGSHTPLILLLGLWTLWQSVAANRHLTMPVSSWLIGGLTILLGGIYVVASAINMALVMAFCAWVGGVLVFWSVFGGQMVRACAFPLAFLGLAVPLPYSLSVVANADLRVFMADHAVFWADKLGLDVAFDRSSIFVNQYRLALEAACAGTSTTISLIAFVLLFTYWYRGGDMRRTAISVALAIPIALIANILRVLVLIVAVDQMGLPVLDSVLHPLAGLISFALALVLFLASDRLIRATLRHIDRVAG